ncbi:MAG: hypothetical protein JW755_04235 [Candidatus Aminicenantes bacterium]|nr:hypothetical protein [Candidatus Aminicenantes bacterium]
MSKATIQQTKNKKKNTVRLIFPAALFLFILSAGFFSLAYFLPPQTSSLSLSAAVDHTKIPLNRLLKLKVTLAWIGGPGIFTILSFNDPALTNLEISGTSTSNRTEASEQGTRVIREYEYTLKPKGLGMAYIEIVSIKVHNNLEETDETLQTRRIPVEVIDPVPETEKGGNWRLYSLLSLLAAVVALLTWFYIRKKRILKKLPLPEIREPIETRFLAELRDTWDLNNLNLHQDFSAMSRLLRRFLSEKYKIRAMEATTDKLLAELQATDMHENQIQSIKEILLRTDEIKFSGTKGNREEFTRFFTLIEAMLETFLQNPENTTQPHNPKQGDKNQ